MRRKKLDFYSLEPDTVSALSDLISSTQTTDMLTPTLSNICTLHNEIIRQKEERSFQHKTIHNQYLHNKKIYIFNPPHIKLKGKCYRSFETSIIADEIAVIDNMLISFHKNILRIYKYNSKLIFSKIKEIRTHTLLFLIRTKMLKYNSRQVLYNIVMVLVYQKIERIDIFLDNILEILNVDEIDEMYFVGKYLVCDYRNGEKKCFDDIMNVIDIKLEKQERRIEIEKDVVVKERDSWVEIDYECKNYVDIIDTGTVKQCVYIGDYMFILGIESIKILKFHQ